MRTAESNAGLGAVLGFHVAFLAVSAAVLWAPVGYLGWRIAGLVAGYHVAWVALALLRGWRNALALWWMLLPITILQVLPDWFLSAVVGSLQFADLGVPRIGTVPVFMAGMWTIPLLLIVSVAHAAAVRFGAVAGELTAGLMAVAVFVPAEALAWRVPIWTAVDVLTVQHVALYVVPAEILLGIGAWRCWAVPRRGAERLRAALRLPILYAGALALSYLLIERWLVSLLV